MMKENWVYCRGDIYCAKLDPVVGSEQGGIRPVIVIQNDTGNKHAPTLIVATVTTRIHKKANMPTHFVIYDNPAFKEASVVQLEQIRTIDKSRIDNYLGKVTPREMVAIEKALSVSLAMEQLKKGLPKVVFHSLRHSSITYKLKLNGGDMKSVQGDSGHAQVKMVADVYSHIIDDDRRLNAERMEAAFYSGRQATPEPVQPAATESSADDKELLLKLLQNPEMAALLKSLAKTL